MTRDFVVGFEDLTAEVDVASLPVSGEVPGWLAGNFLRNGPALFTVAGQRYDHWFDGLAMLHRFGFDRGTVSYRNRFLRSRNFTRVMASGRRQYDQFGTSPPRSFFRKIVDSLDFSLQFGNNDLVSFGRLDDRWVALGETPTPLTIDPFTLETRGAFRFADCLVAMLTSAHPVRDERRRTAFNYDTFVFPCLSRYLLWRLDDGSRKRRCLLSRSVARPSYMHSFGASENHLILTEFPLKVSPLSMVSSCFTGTPFIENFTWTGEDVRFLVVDKDTGEVTGDFSAPAFFAFHHVNAVEDGDGTIVLDIAAYDDDAVIRRTFFRALLGPDGGDMPVSRLVRYRVPVRGKGPLGKPEALADPAFEMPRLHPGYVGRPYRFVYGYGFDHRGGFNDTLYKLDLQAPPGERVLRFTEPSFYPSEPVFVPRPGGTDEDDGVVLSVVLDAAGRRSFLLVLDARRFTELARVALPHMIPFGLHGAFAEPDGPRPERGAR